MAISLALGAWVGAVAWRDWATRRIPNLLLLAALVPALVVLAWRGEGLLGASVLQSLAGFLLGGGLLLPGYASGQLGAGDVKFAACLGGIAGGFRALETILLAAILLGAASLIVMAYSARNSGPGVGSRRIPAGPALAAAFVLELAAGSWLRHLVK